MMATVNQIVTGPQKGYLNKLKENVPKPCCVLYKERKSLTINIWYTEIRSSALFNFNFAYYGHMAKTLFSDSWLCIHDVDVYEYMSYNLHHNATLICN